MLILALIQSSIILLWRDEKLFNFLCGILWIPLFSLAVICYRYLYKTRQWSQWGTGKNIAAVLGYSLASGFIVALLMLGIVIPFFWEDVEKILLQHNISVSTILTQLFITNWFQTQLLVGGWIFIYISITSRQLIQQTELTNLRLQNSLRESQLANLANQLNPHFLFNTLNNIKFMVRRDPLKSEKMITDLSDILRYSLESNKREKVTISDEIEIVNRYINVIKVQMEDRLNFELSVPEKLHTYLVPPMILQLLIENAIKHGVDSLRHGGQVRLVAEELLNRIRFTIVNDIPNKNLINSKSTGIGLANIEQRLSLLYGDEASFSVEEKESQFYVSLAIPREHS